MVTSNDVILYDTLPNLILGFHGCSVETYEQVLFHHESLRQSENDYDWLGHGIYFWENGYERALDWAEARYGANGKVIGAVLNLGLCLNLTDVRSTGMLEQAYIYLERMYKALGDEMPRNMHGRSETDFLLRNLDCAVIEQVHALREIHGLTAFDSVRGVFVEGESAFPGSAIAKKTHIQICVVNPNCIKGYFSPISVDKNHRIP